MKYHKIIIWGIFISLLGTLSGSVVSEDGFVTISPVAGFASRFEILPSTVLVQKEKVEKVGKISNHLLELDKTLSESEHDVVDYFYIVCQTFALRVAIQHYHLPAMPINRCDNISRKYILYRSLYEHTPNRMNSPVYGPKSMNIIGCQKSGLDERNGLYYYGAAHFAGLKDLYAIDGYADLKDEEVLRYAVEKLLSTLKVVELDDK